MKQKLLGIEDMAYISDQPAVGQAVPLADYAEQSEP